MCEWYSSLRTIALAKHLDLRYSATVLYWAFGIQQYDCDRPVIACMVQSRALSRRIGRVVTEELLRDINQWEKHCTDFACHSVGFPAADAYSTFVGWQNERE